MQIATVFRVCFIAGIITFSSANFTQAQSSRQISYQGIVTQGDAKISDGWYSLTFALYGSVGSSVPLWQEEQRVYFQHGLFNVMLGAEFPLPERLPEDAWIGISFQGSGEFTRTKLTAVPYAMQAGIAEKAMYAEKAGELEGGVVSSINGIQGNVLMKASDGLEIRTDEEGGLIVGLSNEKRYEGILNQGTEWLLAGNTNANASSWLGTSNNFPLVIRTNNTERMRILSSNGNIGMGTTSPAERLHIVGNAQVDGNIVIKPTSSTSGQLRILENGGTQYTAFKSPQLSNNVIYTLPINDGNIGDVLTSDGSGVLSWQSVDGWGLSGNVVGAGKFIGTLNAQPLSFRTNNAERMSIGTTGNVAIGEATTSSKLTVAQSLFITNTGGTPEIKIEAPNNTTSTILKTTNQSANIVYTLPPNDGNNGQFLRTNGSGVLTWSDAGGGLTHFSETRNTAVPNTFTPAHRFAANGNEVNIDFVLSPKGTGAIMADIPDGTSTGGNKRGTNAVDWQMSRDNANEVASGDYSTIGGGLENTASGYASFVGGGEANRASAYASFVGGGLDNTASGYISFVGGGRNNTSSGDYSFVGGGYNNFANGGLFSFGFGGYAFVGGGADNTAIGFASFVGGGADNTAIGFASFVGGGRNNTSSGDYSFVGGGYNNFANGGFSSISGGRGLTLDANANRSFGFHANNVDGTRDMTISAANTAVFGNVDLWLANNDNSPRSLRFYEQYNAEGNFPNGTNYVGFRAPNNISADITYTLPASAPTSNGQVLSSTTEGVLSWITSGGGTVTMGGDLSGSSDNAQIVANAVGSNEISNHAVTTSKIADGNVTLSKISQSGATIGQVLKWNDGGWSPSGDNSGMVNFSETRTVSAPNETRPVHQLSVVGSEANIDMALSPKGEGALTAHSADASYIGGDKRGQYAVDWQRSRVLDMYSLPYTEGYITNASNYVASGNYSVIAGGANNAAIGDYSNVGGGFNNIGHGLYATISGGNVNMSIGDGAAIGGGEANIAEGVASVIGGGVNNYAKNEINVIAGGYQNISDGLVSTISGGQSNTTNADYTTVSGGQNNHVNGAYSTIIGGNGLTLNGTGSIGYLGNNDGSRDMAVNADNTAVLGNLNLWIINNDNTAHDIRMFEASNDGDNYTAFKAQAQSTDITYTLPASAPTSNGQVLSSTTEGVLSWITSGGGTVTMGGDLSGSADNAQIIAGAVGSNEIADNAILTSKIADGNITLSKISQSGATNGQVLKWNGSAWSPSSDDGSVYSAGTGISISSGIISSTGDTDASDDIVVSSTSGGDVSGTFSNLQIVANAVGSAEIADNAILTSKIADGNITLSKISQSGATNGQVLKWNGSAWSPSVDANTEYSAGTGISISSGIISSTGDTDASDDIVVSSTSGGDVSGTFSNLQIVANAVGSNEISDNAIITSKIADGNITLSKISQSGATNGQVLKWNGSAWSPSGDNSGMVNFSETRTVSAPNETRPIHQLSVVGSEANIDMALSPKGEGALTAHSANNALSGGNKRGQYAVDFQTVRSAATQVASGSRSSIGGGEQNTASGGYSRVGGGYANIASGSNSVVSGGLWNTASSLDAVISGGRSNTASGMASTVAGGESNLASAEYSFVGGGVGNQATGARSSVLGGYNNRSQSSYSVVLGGTGMTLNGAASNSFGFLGANAGNNNMTIAAANTGVLGNVNLWLANNDGNAREIRFYEPNSATGTFPATGVFYTAFKAQAQDSSYTYTLPSSAPISNGQVLTASTGGTMSWATKSLKITVNNFDPDEVNAASFANFTVTANGVTTTDVISLHRVGGFGNLIVASAYVNTNNQVTIRVYNPTASPVNLGAENIIIGVIRE